MLGRLLSAVTPACAHVPETHAEARSNRCEECGARFNLRVCSTCGHVGCCDSHQGHARLHFHTTGHPVMRSKTSLGAGFTWCYPDSRYVRG